MAVESIRNEFNLIQRPYGEKQTLEKMRKKLASARPDAIAKPPSLKVRKQSRAWTWALIIAGFLLSLNVIFETEKDEIFAALGVEEEAKPLAPKPGMSLDNQARFWAYAAFNSAKLHSRFKVPDNALIDEENAKHHLQALLARDLGAEARAEVLALKNEHETGASL